MPSKRSLEASATQAGAGKRRRASQPEQNALDKSGEAAATAGNLKGENVDTAQGQAFVGSGRQAAQGINYKERAGHVAHDSKLIVKQEQMAENELQAVQNTKTEQPGTRRFATTVAQYTLCVTLRLTPILPQHNVGTPNMGRAFSVCLALARLLFHLHGICHSHHAFCRLVDFQLADEQGGLQAIESLDTGSVTLHITGKLACLPSKCNLLFPSGQGRLTYMQVYCRHHTPSTWPNEEGLWVQACQVWPSHCLDHRLLTGGCAGLCIKCPRP